MQLEPVIIALFTGLIASEDFILVQFYSGNAIVVADQHPKCIDGINLTFILLFPVLGQQFEKHQEEGFQAMQPSREAALAEQFADI